MIMTKMTLAEFRATAVPTEDIGAHVEDDGLEGCHGRMYFGKLFIHVPVDPDQRDLDSRHWWTTLDNREPVGTLAEVEKELYDWAVSAGYIERAPLLKQVLAEPDLDAALKLIMDALKIESGDVAGQVFSGQDQEIEANWRAAPQVKRAALLIPWLRAELAHAAE